MRRAKQQKQQPQQQRHQRLSLLDLDDACLSIIVSKLGLTRRTVMTVSKRLKSLAEAAVHSYQQEGQSVMDAVELAQPGDTLHLLPVRFKEALLLRKPLHLTCDSGRASILSPARFAVMVTAGGCVLENLVFKSHQIDEGSFYLIEQGPACRYIQLQDCEVLQGSFVGINETASENTRMVLRRCLLHVGLSAMKGRLEVEDTSVKCSGDSLFATADATVALRRCSFIDFQEAVTIESRTAVVEHCDFVAFDRGPLVVSCGHHSDDVFPDDHEDINSKLLYLEDAPFDFPVLMCNHAPDAATGTSANEEQRAAVQAGGLVEGHVVLWGNTAFESRSNENITAQQEEVRREARQIMQQMHNAVAAAEWGEGGDEPDLSIGNSVEDPLSMDEGEFDDEDGVDWDGQDGWDDWGSQSDSEWEELPPGEAGDVVDLVSDDSYTTSSSSGGSSGSEGGSEGGSLGGSEGGSEPSSSSDGGEGGQRQGSEQEESSSSGGSSQG
ncbi:hypothetical protein COHA_002139 [Chlorella ohadii]|uniref:Uncharacterized protein n=1 Tax=Chlorella ohadii TaxID=2649997 RepID=A0AAD5H582_9CHLO|nr:hypothetical protein COHA_002139 [Chlorella ohadii]